MSLLNKLNNLIRLDEISNLSAEDIVGQICMGLYEEENYHIRDNEIFLRLPTILKDIILIIDFDAELSMNGILDFLENSTGLFLDDTILALERIKAHEDYLVLNKIKDILKKYGVCPYDLRCSVNKSNLYEISSFSTTHDNKYNEMAEEISREAKKLYLYSESVNIFDYLIEYVQQNKELLHESLLER